MPANYSVNARHARLNSCLNATGVAAGTSVNGVTAGAGQLVIGTSALSGATGVLATVTLTGNPPFTLGDISATTVATLVVGGGLSATPSASGTAAAAEFRDSGGTTVISGLTVGASPSFDVQVTTVSIVTTQTFQVTGATIITS